MCLILLAWQAHPDYPLIVAANRDEFLERPAAPLAPWAEQPDLCAGRDLRGGGTWMGVSRRGRFAALTNFRAPGRQLSDAPSRGMLVSGTLSSPSGTLDALRALQPEAARYNGFNLLLWDGETLGVLESTREQVTALTPGVHGLSNALMNSPWPKVERGCSGLKHLLAGEPEPEALLALLRKDAPAADADLPQTGVSQGWERLLSPAFIRAPGYGTRCSTVLRVHRSGAMDLHEWSWDALGRATGRVSLSL